MTLEEISRCYREAAALLRYRLKCLRQELETAQAPEEVWHIKRRIAELTPILTQMNDLADLTEHYYDRGYPHDKRYTF